MNTLLRIGLRNASNIRSTRLPINKSFIAGSILTTSRGLATRSRIAKASNSSIQSQKESLSKEREPPEEPKDEESGHNNKEQAHPEPNYWRSSYRLSLLFAFQFFIFGHFVANHFYALTWPYGASMLPTMYLSGECVLISRHYAHGRDVYVGDVICALHPTYPEGNAVIKRVLGMPGDFVCDGLFENGEVRMVKVPRGHCWLAGDNQGFSRDSRHYGPVPLGLVTGKVVWRIWPWDRWGEIENTMEEVDDTYLAA